MNGKRGLTTVVLISAMGMLLTLWGLSIGASYASTPTPPPPADPLTDTAIVLNAASGLVLAEPLRRVQTTTLEPTIEDLMSGTWPVYVQDFYYNWPGSPAYIYVPTKSWDYEGHTAAGELVWAVTNTGYYANPSRQAWVAVSYRKRDSATTGPYAVQQGGLITLVSRAGGGALVYSPLTSTLIYTRFMQDRAELDHWGIAHSLPYLLSTDPMPQYQSIEENRTTWVANTISGTAFNGRVVLSDTIFGSDLTITHFSMNPLTPTLYNQVNFTVAIRNNGVMTAWRWFANEIYLRYATDAPPSSAYDHNWGTILYAGNALLQRPETPAPDDWQISELGPGQTITLTTAITVIGAQGAGYFKAYAQVDVQDQPGVHYAWFGSNPEGYCTRAEGCDVNTRPPEEYNVATLRDEYGQVFTINIPISYSLEVKPTWAWKKAPAGHTATFDLKVYNWGNYTDTYTITIVNDKGWTTSYPMTVGPVLKPMVDTSTQQLRFIGNEKSFLTKVGVPAGTPEDEDNWVTVTVQSSDPTTFRFVNVRLQTISGWYRLYLPIVRKNK